MFGHIFFTFRSCVRVVKSEKAGMGKSLYKTRLAERLVERYSVEVFKGFPLSITIPLSQKQIEMSEVSNRILECTLPDGVLYPRLFHIDIAYGVNLNLMNYCFYNKDVFYKEPWFSWFNN